MLNQERSEFSITIPRSLLRIVYGNEATASYTTTFSIPSVTICGRSIGTSIVWGGALRYQNLLRQYTRFRFLLLLWWFLIRYLIPLTLLIVLVVSGVSFFSSGVTYVEIGIVAFMILVVATIIVRNFSRDIYRYIE